jgi:hypothetical protein
MLEVLKAVATAFLTAFQRSSVGSVRMLGCPFGPVNCDEHRINERQFLLVGFRFYMSFFGHSKAECLAAACYQGQDAGVAL